MRLLVHDYCGHPFQAQLSRRLAARRHEVLHLYSQSVVSPQGSLIAKADDPPTVQFLGIRLAATIDRQTRVRRYLQEVLYGGLLATEIRRFRPDVVLSANTPLEAQSRALAAAHSVHARFIFWLQDIHGIAIERLLFQQLGPLGALVGLYYRRKERRLLSRSDAIVAISGDFYSVLHEWNVSPSAIAVIPNWASPHELPQRPKDNSWARQRGLVDQFCFLYSGTLGMKHNPELLLQLAAQYRNTQGVKVIVISEGSGAEWLKAKGLQLRLAGLEVLPFQPYADLPNVMGSADVLLAILEPDAGIFSVPSKVLSYLCAGRPLLLAVPPENLAARTVLAAGAGAVVDPRDVQEFLIEAENLRSDPARRAQMQKNAIAYATETFDIDRITDRFEAVIREALGRKENEARAGLRRGGVHR